MKSLQHSQIPSYLHTSVFYQALNPEDADCEAICIPERGFKENDDVGNIDDFSQLLHTMQFRGVNEIPAGMIKFLNFVKFAAIQPVVVEVPDPNSRTNRKIYPVDRKRAI